MWPLLAFADSVDEFFFKLNKTIINPAIEFAFIIAFAVFIFGMVEFMRGAANEKMRTKGKDHMLWGIIGFVIMFGVFGIVTILANTIGTPNITVNQKEQKIELPIERLQQLKVPQ